MHYEWASRSCQTIAVARGARYMYCGRKRLHVKLCEELEQMRLYEWLKIVLVRRAFVLQVLESQAPTYSQAERQTQAS